jgi:DNA invertase Pin-like site-specific DNA recombinase
MFDITTAHGKLIIAVLGALAEFERSMILAKTADGRARALARGVKFGRKRVLSPFQIAKALARREAGEIVAVASAIHIEAVTASDDIMRPPAGEQGA